MAKKKSRSRSSDPKKYLPVSAGGPEVIEESGVEDAPFTQPDLGIGMPNNRRIRTVGDARQLAVQLYLEGQLRSQSFSQVRNQIEGGRPFDPAVLQRQGEGWRTNVNFRDAEAAFMRAWTPYWKMVHEVPRLISVQIEADSPDRIKWGISMAEAFDEFISDWGPDYYLQYQGMSRDYVKYGSGFVMWEDGRSPRCKHSHTIQMYFPKRTKANPDDWELVSIRREMTADQLIAHIQDGPTTDRAKTAGWNPEMIKRAIALASPGPQQTRYLDPNFWQDMVVANDLVIGGVWPPIAVIDLWAIQRGTSGDGKRAIRHYIYTEKTDVPDYLYEADEEADGFRQIIGPVFYDVGENGLIHTIKGFGVKNYYYATVINRTKCRIIDAATFSMGINFVKGDATPDETPPVENYGIINLFPPGLDQLQFQPQLGPIKDLILMLKENQDENNYQYNDTESRKQIADTETAKQAELLSANQQEMTTAQSATYLVQIGTNLYAEMVRRLCISGSSDPDAKEFQRRCKAKNVPDDAMFKLKKRVTTSARPTMASPSMRAAVANHLMTRIFPQPDANRRAILEFDVANSAGAQGCQDFLLPVGVASDPRARREAMMENVDLAQGIELPVDPSDAHTEHCDEHLKPLEAIVQQLNQAPIPGMTIVPQKPQVTPEHLIALQFGIPHIQAHVGYLGMDETRRAQYKQMKARLANVMSVYRGIAIRLQKAQARGGPPEQITQALQSPTGA